ncbi:MAG: Zn-ribbon domain-containing OB-fold protein [Polyangiales bacterium]
MSDPITRIKTPVHLEYGVYPGTHYSMYLRALEQGRFIGGRCPATKKVYVPPRGASPVCGLPTDEIVDVQDVGVLTTFAVIRIPFEGQKMKPPYCFGAIVLDGADLPIYHLIGGIPYEEVRMGMRVKAKWKPRDQWGTTLENIECFEPTGEPDQPFETYSEHL